MRKLREVMRLRFELHLGYQQIGRSCAIGVSTVCKYLKRAEAAGLTWPLPEGWDDARVEAALFPRSGPRASERTPARSKPDFVSIHGDTYIGKHGLSLRLRGMEKGINDKSMERAIVIHAAKLRQREGGHARRAYRAKLGCPAVRPEVSRQLIETVRGGAVLLAYFPESGRGTFRRMTTPGKPQHFSYTNLIVGHIHALDPVACANFSFGEDRQIETRAAA
jgi:L,D-transpeptidase catalytic domain